MSPLLGRPAPDTASALARGGILAVATLLAWTPLSLLFTAPDWWFVPLCCTLAILGAGALARAVLPSPALVPIVHLLGVGALTLFVEVTTGVLEAQHDVVRPGSGLVSAQAQVLRAGIEEIGGGRAPVDLTGPGQVVLALAVALVVVVLDLLFLDLGWHTPTGFLLLALMLVPALMYPEGGPWWTASGPLAGALIVFAARTLHADGAYLHGDERPQTGPLSRRTALTLVTTGTVGAVLVGAPALSALLPRPARPLLPLDIDTLNAWRGQESLDYGAVMIDDSISVRRDLMRRGETEVLRLVTDAEQPDYLRLHTLTRFDGDSFLRAGTWGEDGSSLMPESFTDRRQSGGPVPGGARYDITLVSLEGDALPAPPAIGWYETPLDAQIDAATAADGALALAAGVQDLSGVSYSVSSRPPAYTAADLRAVSVSALSEPFETGYLVGEVPAMVADLADQVAADAGATGAYDTARALVDFFHREFEYSLSVTTPPGADPITSFLQERVGYCEQYAATFALMMDARGYPTRVAIGFTSGREDGQERVVTNHNAHAWPEVWFGADFGWVRFEPTPPAAGSGTSSPAHEDEDAPAAEQTTPQTTPTAQPTTAPSAQTTTTTAEPSAEQTTTTAPGTEEGGGAERTADGPGPLALGIGGTLLGAGGIGAGLWWRHRRRLRAREQRWAALGAVAEATADGAAASAAPGTATPGPGGASTPAAGAVEGAGAPGTGAAEGAAAPATGAAEGAAPPAAGAADGAAAPGAGAAGAVPVPAPAPELVRRAAGELAWTEIAAALAQRRRAIRLLGWTGRWGRPPGEAALDPALPPREALQALLTRLATLGRWAGKGSEADVVTPAHEAAALRIADALSSSRYAPPPAAARPPDASRPPAAAHPPEAEPRPEARPPEPEPPLGATPSPRPAPAPASTTTTGAAGSSEDMHSDPRTQLREDVDLLIALIRSV